MFDFLKNQIFGIAACVLAVFALLGGTTAPGATLGTDTTTFTNPITFDDNVTMGNPVAMTDTVTIGSATASSSVDFGKACWEVQTNVGSTTYISFIGTGTSVRLATSTTSCL